MAPTRAWTDTLYEDLRDPKTAEKYLNDALHDGPEVFLLALRDVVGASERALAGIAEDVGLSRRQLYRIMAEGGNPTLASLEKILAALGFEIQVAAKRHNAA